MMLAVNGSGDTDSHLDTSAFRNAMREWTIHATNYAIAMTGNRDAAPRLPGADSPAMRELASEHRWATPAWDCPVFNAHAYGGLLVYVLAEHLAALATIAETGNVGPAFAHAPSARAIMEIAPTASWLLDPEIGTETRIQRSILYRLDSINQVGRLQHLASAREDSKRSRAAVKTYARAQGWRPVSHNGRLSIGSESMPDPATTFSTYALGAPDVNLDRTLWGVLSALQHGTWYAHVSGLAGRMQPDPMDPRTGVAPIVVDGAHLTLIGLLCWKACRAAYEAQRQLMGWNRPSAMDAPERALTAVTKSVADAARQGSLDIA